MVRQEEIDGRVERFVQQILGLVREVRRDAVSAVGIAAGAAYSDKKLVARAVKTRPADRRAPRLRTPVDQPASDRAPKSGTVATQPSDAATAPSERQEAVLDALRALVRAGAADIARHAGLANGTTAVVLRSLAAAGRVAKVDGKYGLVSEGTVTPFKRASRG